MSQNQDTIRGKRPRPCNAERCVCKWLLWHAQRENAKLR